jgi:hypothetical protein
MSGPYAGRDLSLLAGTSALHMVSGSFGFVIDRSCCAHFSVILPRQTEGVRNVDEDR